jgi:hypothetical protein
VWNVPAKKQTHRLKPVLLFTESATETIPPAARNPVIARRKTFGTSSKVREVGKGEKVG